MALILILAGILAVSVASIELKEQAKKGKVSFDVIECMDESTVKTDGEYTYFTCNMPNGSQIRFCGTNISVDGNGITFKREGGELYSLDAIGTIKCIEVTGTGLDENESQAQINYGVGYTFSDTIAIDNPDDAIFMGTNGIDASFIQKGTNLWYDLLKPNFLYMNNCPYIEEQRGDYTLTKMKVYYDNTKTVKVKDIQLNSEFYTGYLEGDLYDPTREEFNPEDGSFSFYLQVAPDIDGADTNEPDKSLWGVKNFTIGELRDTEGNVLDKENTPLQPGYTLDITLCGETTVAMKLPVVQPFTGAQNMHDLVPCAFPAAEGEMNVLVVSVAWADLQGEANEANLEIIRSSLGRVVGADGTVSDYSNNSDAKFSLAEYFDIASYNNLKLMPFVTDWYNSEDNYADVKSDANGIEYAQEVLEWVKKTYPNIDWTKYDKDANGYVDAMIIINAGDEAMDPPTIGGAAHYRAAYANQYAGTQKDPGVLCYVNMSMPWLSDEGLGHNTLIHEFGHNLGIIDYYDVTYSGIDAVGSYDMQSQSMGDWNAYSKYSVGWIEPEVVTGLSSGQSVEIEIGSFAETGDAIVIPAAGSEHEGVFGEYILVDLFTDDGTNTYDASQYGLSDLSGVRIYHVNAVMEKHVEEHGGEKFDIGTIHYPNVYNKAGKYNIELLQKGKVNTFTKRDDRMVVNNEDFFYAGDSFTMNEYSEFFCNGRMDNGDDFGYRIDVVSIENDTATIRITAE